MYEIGISFNVTVYVLSLVKPDTVMVETCAVWGALLIRLIASRANIASQSPLYPAGRRGLA